MIYVTGDLHGHIDINKLSSKTFKEGRLLVKSDYVIVTGDFGLIWDINESKSQEQYWLDWLSDKPWTTLFLDGNHENFDRLYALPEVEMFGGKVGKVTDSIYHLKRGEIYNIQGHKIFTFGGGASIDKAIRQDRISWWREEIPSHAEMQYGLDNLEKHDFKVDYVLTHTGPADLIGDIPFLIVEKLKDATTEYLKIIKEVTSFKMWYFGHFHIDIVLKNLYVCQYHNIVKLGESK